MEKMGNKIGSWGQSMKVRHAQLCQEVVRKREKCAESI